MFQRNALNFLELRFMRARHKRIALITAFDDSHFHSGLQLLTSIEDFNLMIDVYVYNLGLDELQMNSIQEMFPKVKLVNFDFCKYPDYFNVKLNAGQYAWKATIVSYFLSKDFEHLLWLDAGDKFIGNLENIQKLIDKYGFFAVPTSNTIKELTHKDSILKLGLNPHECNQLQLSAAFIGFCLKNQAVAKLIEEWAGYSKREEIIAPPGSDRSNHRQDQSIFNLLVNRNPGLLRSSQIIASRKYTPQLHKILTHQDVDSI
jgi:hypothetical protein